MKFNEMTIFIFIASIIIGVLISLNINFNGAASSTMLNTQQYQEAYDTKNKLQRQLSNLKDQYYENTIKLDKYKYGRVDNTKVLQDISKEVNKNSALMGTKEVKGSGILLTLNDASGEFSNTIDNYEWYYRLIHNVDIMYVLNSLRNAGAEAISINDQRVMYNSEVYCYDQFIRVNGVKLPAPYYISAIGNPDVLESYMWSEEGYLSILDTRGIEINLESSDEVKIPAYVGEVSYKYMREIEK
jgi:uncharacterized protein YlxW (UPF0749 family)